MTEFDQIVELILKDYLGKPQESIKEVKAQGVKVQTFNPKYDVDVEFHQKEGLIGVHVMEGDRTWFTQWVDTRKSQVRLKEEIESLFLYLKMYIFEDMDQPVSNRKRGELG